MTQVVCRAECNRSRFAGVMRPRDGPRHLRESEWKRRQGDAPAMAIGLSVPERARRVVSRDLEIAILGPCSYPSPLAQRLAQSAIHYVGKADRVLLNDRLSQVMEHEAELGATPAFELAGPRH